MWYYESTILQKKTPPKKNNNIETKSKTLKTNKNKQKTTNEKTPKKNGAVESSASADANFVYFAAELDLSDQFKVQIFQTALYKKKFQDIPLP